MVLSLFWASLLIVMVAFLIHRQWLTEVEVKERTRAYLCFKRQVIRQLHFIKKMIQLNRIIQQGYILMLTPKTASWGATLMEGAKKAQQLLNAQYSATLYLKTCRQKNHQLDHPFGVVLQRNAWGLAKFRKRQWKIVIYQNKGLRPFQLKAVLRAKTEEVYIQYQEKRYTSIKEALWWKRWPGVEYFF